MTSEGTKKAPTLSELLAAQRTVAVTMTDKSGNAWEFNLSPLCARIADAMDRLHPLPTPPLKRTPEGKLVTDEKGQPIAEPDEAFARLWIAAQAGRTKAAVAAAIGAEWFGPDRKTLPQQIAALEDLFDYAELTRAARVVKGETIVTPKDVEEAREAVAPFASTGASETAAG